MTRTCCPDCYTPVSVPLHAKEGRCAWCRPVKAHSQPRRTNASDTNFRRFVEQHASDTQ